MSDCSASIVSKVWNDAYVLKNARVVYGSYAEVPAARALITHLLFLKLADEMSESSSSEFHRSCRMVTPGGSRPVS